MIEERPIPDLAKSALQMAQTAYRRTMETLSTQTVAALGLREDENWTVNWDKGLLTREVPDPAPAAPVVPHVPTVSPKRTARRRRTRG